MKSGRIYPLILTIVWVLIVSAGGMPAQAAGKDGRQGLLRAAVKLMTPFEFSKDAGSLCSGTALNQEGYILTNFHCVGYPQGGERDRELERAGLRPGDLFNRQGISVVAVTNDPRRLPVPTYTARVLAVDPDLDLAVLKITNYVNSRQPLPKVLPLVTLPLGDSDSVEALDSVVVIGYPGIGGDTVTATEGKISGFVDEDEDNLVDWFKTDVLVNHGNSGGAAVSDKGELIGVPSARLRDQAGNVIYFIRPSNSAVSLIQRAMRAGESAGGAGDATLGSAGVVVGDEKIGQFAFGSGFNRGSVTGPATSFSSSITEVHASVPYRDMQDGMRWGYTWQLDGKTVTSESDLKWKYGPSGVLDLYLKSKDGLPDGPYNLQVFLNDALAQEGELVVGEREFKSMPQKPSADERSTGVTVTGTIIDQSTRKPIQGAAIAFLYPGKTVRNYDADNSKSKANTVQSYGVTSANGVFTSDTPLKRGQSYGVIVSAKGYERIAENDALEIATDDPDVVELEPIEIDRR